jgi:hypothetical protein
MTTVGPDHLTKRTRQRDITHDASCATLPVTQARAARRRQRGGGIDRLPSGGLGGSIPSRSAGTTWPRSSCQVPGCRLRRKWSVPGCYNQVNERRNPRTNATVSQLLDKYLGHLRR